MYCIENKSSEEMLMIIENIQKYLLVNDYENAFIMFLLHIDRMNYTDKTDVIKYFKNYFMKKCSKIVNISPV